MKRRKQTRERLGGEIYLVNPVRKLRAPAAGLDHLLPIRGRQYSHKIITVEHVLPQNPKYDSQWLKDFSDEERLHWTTPAREPRCYSTGRRTARLRTTTSISRS